MRTAAPCWSSFSAWRRRWPRRLVPADDDAVVERLPRAVAGERAELRTLRAQLDREPGNLPLALALAERYIALGRAESDPRFYGYAEGVMRPWAGGERPPPDVMVMRATLAQYRHDFAAAAADLDAAIAADPGNARAWLTLATVDRVQGRYASAGEACSRLFRLAPLIVTFTCLADVGSLHGQAKANYARLHALYQDSDDLDPQVRIWTLTVLAESAARADDPVAAEAHFREALAVGRRDAALLAAYADFLFDRQRPADVRDLLQKEGRADALLLRLAVAERMLGRPGLDGDEAGPGRAHRRRPAAGRPGASARGSALRAVAGRRPGDRAVARQRELAGSARAGRRPPRPRSGTRGQTAGRSRSGPELAGRDRSRRRAVDRARPADRGDAGMKLLLATAVAAGLAVLTWIGPAAAHKPSDSYLRLAAGEDVIEGQWDVALRDLDYAIGIDGNDDGTLTWGEVKAARDRIMAYAFARLALQGDDHPCGIRPGELLIDEHSDGAYAVLRFAGVCGEAAPGRMTVAYDLFADLDPQHRGLLRVDTAHGVQTAILGPGHREAGFVLARSGPGRPVPALRRRGGLAHLDRL